ncbi:MAG: bifunctional DNA primase/polymerase [Pirellulales bacterium]
MYPFGYITFELPPMVKTPPPEGFVTFTHPQPVRNGFNVGVLTNNFCVVDIDHHELIVRFESKFRECITTIIATPRGGRHYYGTNIVRNEQNKGWDVRGWHGYVVGVGSRTTDGSYLALTEVVPITELKNFPDELFQRKKHAAHTSTAFREADPLRLVDRARRWLAKHRPAVTGQRGSDVMFYACCRMFQLGLTMDQAIGPILEYNAKCVPPFSEKEIRHKLEDAQQAEIK